MYSNSWRIAPLNVQGSRSVFPFLILSVAFAFLAIACSSGSKSDEATPTTVVGSGQLPVENPDGTGRPDSPIITGAARLGLATYSVLGCSTCHSGENPSLGPDHTGAFQVAGTRVDGLTAEEYIAQSIREPNAFVVPGFDSPSTMPAFEELTDEEIENVIAFMKTLVIDDGPPDIAVDSLPVGNSDDGRILYGSIGCSGCHSLGTDRIVGPGFRGVIDRAGARRSGLTAEEYILESIIDPSTFIVEGFPRQMPDYDELSEQAIADLLAFLKSAN